MQIVAAIKALKNRKGSSVQAIKKYILANNKGVGFFAFDFLAFFFFFLGAAFPNLKLPVAPMAAADDFGLAKTPEANPLARANLMLTFRRLGLTPLLLARMYFFNSIQKQVLAGVFIRVRVVGIK
jgi:hypothetical protein